MWKRNIHQNLNADSPWNICEVVIYLKVLFRKYMIHPDDNLPLEGLLGTTGLPYNGSYSSILL